MYTTPNNPFSKFVNLLDTPSEYHFGKLLIFDVDQKRIVPVNLEEVPSLESGLIEGFGNLVEDTETIDFLVDEAIKAYVKLKSISANHIKTVNDPFDGSVLLYRAGELIWAQVENQVITIEAKESIQFLQPVTYQGTIARNTLPITNKAFGIAINDANVNEPVYVLYEGRIVNTSWTWSPAAQLYLDNGDITDLPPTALGTFVQKMGNAITEDIIFISPDQTIILI